MTYSGANRFSDDSNWPEKSAVAFEGVIAMAEIASLDVTNSGSWQSCITSMTDFGDLLT